ncbi:acetyl-CoA synthetase-like protein [Guyanagaster necrorhizus]|uniref:Acetyl-CoA synthetase-like protein n=1 Tax=Guyanagaster necrorhizus TaxID=856835 RepID=A0A9P7VV40_9AGAR|nr:acetyl-CoA synthetase-like protein [Guyanagaster necrorhizus MCA 3950]KAG7447913.1 acetyl-CoA synthetase-like protein [Guyanagaster necrorhizus MCA 3950]
MSFSTRRAIPPLPRPQGLSSATFRAPPLDGSLTIQEIYAWHLQHSPSHRMFVYAREDGSIRTISWAEAVAAIYTGARLLRRRIQSATESPVVAILSLSDTITYFVTMMSLLRANYVFFPISPRNSAVAVAHLLHKVGVQHVLIGRDASMQDLANQALEILKSQYSSDTFPELSSIPIPIFEDYFQSQWEQNTHEENLPLPPIDPDSLAFYLHSSGSTAYPKPIAWTHHRLVQLSLVPWFGERDLCDVLFSLHVMPMYHGMGVLQLLWTASSGLVVGAFEPKSPAILPTPENLFDSARTVQSDVIFCVPSFIEAWSRRPEYVEWLSTRSGVLYGGGPLNKEAGDYMTSKGVSVFISYGSTEGGIMSLVLPAQVDYDWDYFQFPGLVKPEMVPNGNNSYELVMMSNSFCQPSVLNTKVNGVDAYATSDLFVPHATKPGFWKVFGRTDDQIIHNTGEKTNPGPLENMLNQDPHVLASVMFGRGKFQAGVLVEPKREFSFDPVDTVLLGQYRNKIWPTVERMNTFAPQHSRLFKEMILVAKPVKPFTYTAKHTARRQAILNDYIEEISDLYQSVEDSTQANISLPFEWNAKSTKSFIRTVVLQVLSHSILDDDDLFQHGCDSLQSTWIRNSLLRALRDTVQFDTRQATDNFVYTHPTISQLAVFFYSLAHGMLDSVNSEPDSRVKAMHAMVKKYSKGLPTRTSDTPIAATSGKIVLVTGTTGSLGSHILASLILDTSVHRIYAVNRPGKLTLSERQRGAFVSRGLNVGLLDSDKVVLVQAEISEGIDFFDELSGPITHIIHNAWRVDFNLSLFSYEFNIRGLCNLIALAIKTRARLIFLSSIGIFLNASEEDSLSECPIVPEMALGTGYGESKWVSEELLRTAKDLHYLIIRAGQLCGAANGTWNVNEWVPAMVQSSLKLGCFPGGDRTISWVPVHVAAQAIVDYVDRPEYFIHLVHPKPVLWSGIASVISAELNVKLVPYIQWLDELEKSTLDAAALPAIRILPYYRRNARVVNFNNREAFGLPKITVRDMGFPQIGREDAERWLTYWRRVGFL